MFDDTIKQLETLEGEELARYWLKTMDENPCSEKFNTWFVTCVPQKIKDKLQHAIRQWSDLWSSKPEQHKIPCIECLKKKKHSEMVIDPDPVAKTRWRCPKCGAKF
jgi:hypothetical protein